MADAALGKAAFANFIDNIKASSVIETLLKTHKGPTDQSIQETEKKLVQRVVSIGTGLARRMTEQRKQRASERWAAQHAKARATVYSRLRAISNEFHNTRSKNNRSLRLEPDEICALARFTDALPLENYRGVLSCVPEIVNVVGIAIVRSRDESHANENVSLDLMRIATLCTGASFAPKRFAAVQLAQMPRARVLLFSSGQAPAQLVVIGAPGVVSARLALVQTCEQLSREAQVHLYISKFDVINVVGAAHLGRTFNCEMFARDHTSTVHYDRSSFVGLTWRPVSASCCIEIYSTGRANIPGARSQLTLLNEFGKYIPTLLRYSSNTDSGKGQKSDALSVLADKRLDKRNTTSQVDDREECKSASDVNEEEWLLERSNCTDSSDQEQESEREDEEAGQSDLQLESLGGHKLGPSKHGRANDPFQGWSTGLVF